jgi:hypothetical protein
MKAFATPLLVFMGLSGLSAQSQSELPTVLALSPPGTLTNLSCRAYVGTNASIAITGFVVTSPFGFTTQVLIRAVGPTLSKFALTGVLAQPVLTLYDSSGKQVATNTGWGTNPIAAQISAAFAAAGALALPQDSADSALLMTLSPGSYTAEVSGLNGATGPALIEFYNVPPPIAPSSPPPVPPPKSTTPIG